MKVYLTTNIANSSLQIGDNAFYCDVEVLNGSQPINSDDAVALGSITEIGPDLSLIHISEPTRPY